MADEDAKPLWSVLEDETFFLGAVPLQKFKKLLEKSEKEEDYLSFDTCSSGYCTDAVLKVWRDVYLSRIKKKSKYKTSLKKVDLRCCSLVTDSGLGWLAEIVRFSPDLITIQIDGCTKVTDSGLSALKVAAKSVQVSAMATSVTHLNFGSLTKGCPLLVDVKNEQIEDYLQAHILIVPPDTMENSFAEYLQTKSLVQRRSLHHVNSWMAEKWSIAVTEIPHSNPLFESLVPKNPTQVVIPFDASADLPRIKSHIAKTITRILSKETVNPPHKDLDCKVASSDFFLDTLLFEKSLWSSDGVFKSLSCSERVIGCHVSRQPMSRTNCYFEVECLSREGGKDEIAIFMGIVHDVLFSERHPMTSNEKSGGAVEGLPFEVGDVIGFGIEGTWESEYVPMENCSFYFSRNGSQCADKTLQEKPHCGMYPIISVLGKNVGEIKLKNYAGPPEKLQNQWEQEKRYIEPGFCYCVLWDEDGVVTYSDTYKTPGDVGLFVSRNAITKAHNSCTIKILDIGERGTISIGVGPEDYKTKNQPGWLHPSVAFHGDDGSIFLNESGSYNVIEASSPWKKGDEIMAVVSDFNDSMVGDNEDITVTFYRNGKKVKETTLLYKKPVGIRCVFLIGLHSPREKVKVLNFKRPYQLDAPADDMLTMGRANYLKVYDDGTLAYYKFDHRQPFGLYVSKTPISQKLPYFEMKVLKMSPQKHIGIGLCHRDYKTNEMPGWLAGSVAYHADNGQLYSNASLGIRTLEQNPEAIIFGEGDVVGCGVEAVFSGNKLKPQQNIKVYFTKNGTWVHEFEMDYITDGLYPCVALHFDDDRVQLLNFFPGCQKVIHEAPTKTKDEVKTNMLSEGCNFLLVAVGDGTSDAGEKAELLKHHLDLENDLDLIADLENEVERLERNLDSLRVQGQQYYSHLCRQLQCLKQIITQPNRLRFLAVNTKTGQGHEDLVKVILQSQETDREFYPKLYELHTAVKKNLETIVSVVRSRGVIPISELQEATDGIFGESCHLYSRAVKFLHKKGQLVYLPSRISHLALDTEFIKKRLLIGVGTEPNEQVGKRVPCVGETTQIWTKNIISELLKEKGKNMHTVLVYLGVMRLPCIRTKPEDPICFFTTLDKLQPTEAKLSDFWANGKDLENTVVMSRCYKFPNGLPPSLLSATMTLCSMFSRAVLLCPEGGVFQSGAVQTVIVKHHIEKGEAVTIESKCFSPEIDNSAITEETAFHIEEYTWHVYCIFSDIIDFYIANQGLITIMHENAPHWFANSSIGCSHDWSLSDAEHPQTVCTMCNLCCDQGNDCEWSGIMGQYLRECRCGTRVSGCKQCGICKRCADELWQIRSFLRPCTEVSRPSKTGKHGAIPLNGVTSNEVECINLDIRSLPVCLQKQNDSSGAVIQVFPGPAVQIPAIQEIETYNQKIKGTESRLRFDQGDSIKIRLTEIPRTKQLIVEIEEEEEVLEINQVYHTLFCREVRIWHGAGILCYDSDSSSVPVGQFCAARPLTPECNKFSLEIINAGKLKTIAIGVCHRRYLSNRQPGWDPASIAYHADDGGIFIGSGWPNHTVGEVAEGDKMSCHLDMSKQKVIFYHNDKQVFESSKLRTPAGGFYPIIGMHSHGEAIRLLEKEPWLPPREGDMPVPPLAFDAKKYGNLWISPGRTLSLLNRKKNALQGWLLLHNPSKDLIGFLVTASVGDALSIDWCPTGSLAPHKSHCILISLTEAPKSVDIVWFNLELGKEYSEEEIRTFHSNLTSERLHSHSLRVNITSKLLESVKPLRLVAQDQPEDKDVYMLEILKNGGLVEKYWLRGGAYHCLIPVVKPEDTSKDIFLRYPKSPTFDQPNMFQKGMRLVAQPSQNVYAECMILAVSRDGKSLSLEYSPKDTDENIMMDLQIDSEVIQLKEVPLETFEDVKEKMERLKAQGKSVDKKDLKQTEDGSGDTSKGDDSEVGKGVEPEIKKDVNDDVDCAPPMDVQEEEEEGGRSSFSTWGQVSRRNRKKEKEVEEKLKADIEVLGYETRGNFAIEKRGYIFPPLHLLTESARFAIIALDSNWKENSLISQSMCDNVPTRVTVQERQIMVMSRDLQSWVRGSGKDGKIDQAYAFLPRNLNKTNLCHPSVTDMFQDVDVHRLCFLVDQVYFALALEVSLDIPIHFVNIPPIKPKHPLPVSLMYGNIFSGWTYTSLIATKLLLPVCDKVFPGGQPDFSREQLQVLMHQLIQVYAAQCHILAEQYGGLQLQQIYNAGTTEVNSAIAHSDVNVKTSIDMENSSYLLKRKFRNHCLCKTHLWTLEKTNMSDSDSSVDLTMNCFLPYEETVNCFDRDLYTTESLPSDLFTKFTNLQYFSLELCENMKELPTRISSCKRLNTVSLNNMALTVLPSDIFKTPQLESLICTNLLVKSLPTEWPESSKLTRLTISGLQLELLPPEICRLHELIVLDISYNPLRKLPMELGELQKLKILSVCGMPWISMEHNKTITFDIYNDWFNDRPYIQNFLSKQKIKKMFSECDVSKNGMLDVEEVAAVNLLLLWEIPRIGAKHLNDEEYGGIPPAIFLLTSLEELYLDYQAIVAVPVHMCRLLNLRILSLTHNPLLESLPGSLGHLPNIKSIDLLSCPSLRTPPNEVVSRGFESVKAYLKRLAAGFTECRRTKLMFVGLGGAGKTSLLKALLSSMKKTDGTKGEDITDGIVIQPWTIKNHAGVEVTYNTWDFAGQTLYYNTHQFFLSKRAIYLLLWSTRQGFEHAGLDFWLSSVACHAPHTPIFVVGTHCDQVPKADIPQDQLRERYPQIVGFHFVSSVEGKGIAELEEKMLEVTLAQKNMGEKIPQVWLSLEQRILKARTSTSILKWEVVKEYGMDVGIYDEKDIREAIQFLHELGTVQYFDNDFLRDHVVINPQWIVNVMSCVVSVKNSPIQDKKGRFEHKDIPTVWSSYPPALHKWLLRLTEEFDLTFPIPKEPVNIVPCLLPHEVPKDLHWPSVEGREGIRETKIVYKFAYLPAGLFNRAQVRLFQFSNGTLIWKWGSLLKKNKHLALIEQTSDSELIVKVQGPKPENVIFLVHEIFESLIEESFHGVVYHFLVPCPDCILKEGTLEPSLFESRLISHAKDCKAPFIQCRKYFHTISMGQLQDLVPDVSDFDTQLHSRIVALQQLNDDRSTDVAILYSAKDVPDSGQNGDLVHPVWLKDDLEKEKFSVWFCDDMQNISAADLLWGIKNAKVVVALVSDNFERDEKCCNMLWYAMDSPKMRYVIGMIGQSMAWQKTDMGMRIGKQELMVMIKTKSRYNGKVKELLDMVREKWTGIQLMENKDHPPCFISYCWSNSKDAVDKGTMHKDGSLGWGDPRVIKKYLEDNGVSTWIDYEQTSCGGAGLFQRIAQAIRHAKVFVACVSDEYVESVNCMMELRFGVLTIGLPVILCIVGTKGEWKVSEIGILAQRSRASKVFFQKENPQAFETVLTFVKTTIPKMSSLLMKKEAAKKEIPDVKKREASKNTSVSFQEEYELTQRKYMRHIISFISTSDTKPMPRLIVLDFDLKTESNMRQIHVPRENYNPRSSSFGRANLSNMSPSMKHDLSAGRSSMTIGSPSMKHDLSNSRMMNAKQSPLLRTVQYEEIPEDVVDHPIPVRGLRPKTATRSRDRMEPFIMDEEDETWEVENFCIKILCEHEEGWHECEESYPFRKAEDFFDTMRKLAPYLLRIYSILKQSSVQLNCLTGERGDKYQDWIDKESQNTDFFESFSLMRDIVADDDGTSDFLQQLCRCHLPSGKIFWLCGEHQAGPRITKLSLDVGTSKSHRKVVLPEDAALKEIMEKSDIYRKHKAEKSKPQPKLPPPNNAAVITARPSPNMKQLTPSDVTQRRPSHFERADIGVNFKPQPAKTQSSNNLPDTFENTSSRPQLGTSDTVQHKTVAFSCDVSKPSSTAPHSSTSDSNTGVSVPKQSAVPSDSTDSHASVPIPQKQIVSASSSATLPRSSTEKSFRKAGTAADIVTSNKSNSKTCALQ